MVPVGRAEVQVAQGEGVHCCIAGGREVSEREAGGADREGIIDICPVSARDFRDECTVKREEREREKIAMKVADS